MAARIPFNRPSVVGSELDYVAKAVRGLHTNEGGPFTQRAQALMEEQFDAERVLLTTSCTAALEMSALLCDLGPGDEVLMPAYTFVSTANAVVLRGATPVFVDIRPDTLNIDERLIEAAITPRTRAIFPVHYAGVACEMDVIMDIARRHDLLVVEDAAQGVFAKYKDRWLGTIGHLGCYSFHETKNFSCGVGGALVVNDAVFRRRAEVLRDKGTNRSQFLEGLVDKYTWVGEGSAYAPSDMLAAYLLGQLEHMERITAKRRAIYEQYAAELAPLADRRLIQIPTIPADRTSNHHMFHVLTSAPADRAAMIEHLGRAGIAATFHYVPLHDSPFARTRGLSGARLPATEDASSRIVRLPMYFELTESEVSAVCAAVSNFYVRKAAAA